MRNFARCCDASIRSCSSNSQQKSPPQRQSHAFTRLNSFGTLLLKSQGPLNYAIKAIDPVNHPDQDIAAVEAPSCVRCPDDGNDIITVYGCSDADDNTAALDVDIRVPLKFGASLFVLHSATL